VILSRVAEFKQQLFGLSNLFPTEQEEAVISGSGTNEEEEVSDEIKLRRVYAKNKSSVFW